MKKFTENKGPLNLLRQKMKLKAAGDGAYKKFSQELDVVVAESDKFMESLEYLCAVAEALDAAKVLFFHCPTSTQIPVTFKE